MLSGLADTMACSARALAELTVAETGLGLADDKTAKNTFAAREVLASMVGRTGCGLLRRDSGGVTEIARPVGVVLGLMPVTNPVATLVHATLAAGPP